MSSISLLERFSSSNFSLLNESEEFFDTEQAEPLLRDPDTTRLFLATRLSEVAKLYEKDPHEFVEKAEEWFKTNQHRISEVKDLSIIYLEILNISDDQKTLEVKHIIPNLLDQKIQWVSNAIQLFTYLIRIDFSGNLLKQLPDFSCFTRLETLNLSHNKFTVIPAIWGLKNLIYLDMSDNLVTKVPDDVRICKKLKELCLLNNPLEEISEKISKLSLFVYISQGSEKVLTGELKSLLGGYIRVYDPYHRFVTIEEEEDGFVIIQP